MRKRLGYHCFPGLKAAMNHYFQKHDYGSPLELPARSSAQIHSISVRILFGYGLVKYAEMYHKSRTRRKLQGVATGGLSSIIKALNDEFDEVDRNLTLNGIQLWEESYL
jgi:type III pantothenate kinase